MIIHPSAPLNSYVLNQVERCDPQHRSSYMLYQARTRIPITGDRKRNKYFFRFTEKKASPQVGHRESNPSPQYRASIVIRDSNH